MSWLKPSEKELLLSLNNIHKQDFCEFIEKNSIYSDKDNKILISAYEKAIAKFNKSLKDLAKLQRYYLKDIKYLSDKLEYITKLRLSPDDQLKLTYYWMADKKHHVDGCPFPNVKVKDLTSTSCSCPKEHIERTLKTLKNTTLEEYDTGK